MNKEIPTEITQALNDVLKSYSASPANTNAGRVLRFLARFITVETVIKVLAHKLK